MLSWILLGGYSEQVSELRAQDSPQALAVYRTRPLNCGKMGGNRNTKPRISHSYHEERMESVDIKGCTPRYWRGPTLLVSR